MSFGVLFLLFLVPLIGAITSLSAKSDRNYAPYNIYAVSIWTIMANIGIILYILTKLDPQKSGIQLIEQYSWLSFPQIEILFGVDLFSTLLLLGINLSFLVAGLCNNTQGEKSKTLVVSQLLFISALNGYIMAADIISFYIFFAAISVPLIVMLSSGEWLNKKNILIRFGLYNLIGMILLFIAIIMIYNYKGGNIPLNMAGNVSIRGITEYFVWLSIFFAFISRLPIWPFHYWLSSINATMRNSFVFNVSNLIPLIGLYGFMRFWPNTVPETIAVYAPFFEAVCIITMLLVSFISLTNEEFRYKLFAYTTVYYLLYLTGVFLPTSGIKMNIGYALFAYIIISTVLSFVYSHIEQEQKQLEAECIGNILHRMPRVSICLSLYVLAGIGLPITPLFGNNFIIISEIFNYNLIIGILIMLSMFLVGLSMLKSIYHMKDRTENMTLQSQIKDISNLRFGIYMGCLLILFISFIQPLWFVF